MDDGSRQLRPGTIDLLTTTTPGETSALVADGTPYALTAKEVERTGMPRLDRLRALASAGPPPDLLLVAPDLRDWLTVPVDTEHGRVDRRPRPTLLTSEYATRWHALLASPELAALASRAGLGRAFLPHPDLAGILGASWLPPDVELLPAVGEDAQAQLARVGVLVTDYRPLAFDIAGIGRPVVHFQFDAEERGIGALRGRATTFDWARDGFGPVAADEPGVLAALETVLADGPGLSEPYATRAAAAFPERDGLAWRRIVDAVQRRSRAWTGGD